MKNTKKIKEQYRKASKPIIYNNCYFGPKNYASLKNWLFRRFNTVPEKSAYEIHMIEYKMYGLKLRSARGMNLTSINEDKNSFAYKYRKCWKNNSKRKHQYFKEIIKNV